MCCYLGFVVPFVGHRQGRCSIILKGPRIFRMVSKHCFNLVSSCISPWLACPLKVLKPDIDFTCLVINVLGGSFSNRGLLQLQWKSVMYCSLLHELSCLDFLWDTTSPHCLDHPMQSGTFSALCPLYPNSILPPSLWQPKMLPHITRAP